jgi:hypothetical protein
MSGRPVLSTLPGLRRGVHPVEVCMHRPLADWCTPAYVTFSRVKLPHTWRPCLRWWQTPGQVLGRPAVHARTAQAHAWAST